ncbi:MAG: HAD hydrolase-like protein [Oscillospiraceae bacterium]|nr:HAD hydrolase-like protein [Oscillospiraceae bacterium]
MRSKSVVIFDLDGTLTDPREGITRSYQYALAAFGIHEALDGLTQFIGPPLRAVFSEHYGFSPADTERATAKFREYLFETGLFENTVYPGIPELLQALRDRDKTLALATNKVLTCTVRILEHFRLSRYFSFVSGDDMDGTLTKGGKREIIRIALDGVGCTDKSSAVMVGDRKHDVIGARENGLESIGVLYGYGSRRELTDAGAAVLAETVTELANILKG